MLYTYNELLELNKEYANPHTKIKRMVKSKELFQVVRGLYASTDKIDPFMLANAIYGPSYISLQTALSYHGLIPERVYEITSVTCLKNRRKEFNSPFGRFTYRDVPMDVFPFETVNLSTKEYSCLIASPEKAICDMLYAMPPVRSIKDIKEMLFDDLRIDEGIFASLNTQRMAKISSMYHTSNNKALVSLLTKEK